MTVSAACYAATSRRAQVCKGTTKELFRYDGASRTTLVQNDDIFSTRLMTCRFAYDSLDNRTLDQQETPRRPFLLRWSCRTA